MAIRTEGDNSDGINDSGHGVVAAVWRRIRAEEEENTRVENADAMVVMAVSGAATEMVAMWSR